MLQAFEPLPGVLASEEMWVVVNEFARAVPFPFFELSLVEFFCREVPIGSCSVELSILDHALVKIGLGFDHSVSVHVSVVKLARVHFGVARIEKVLAEAGHLSMLPLSFVAFIVRNKIHLAVAALFALDELSFEDVAGAVGNNSLAVHEVVLPEALLDISVACNHFPVAFESAL